MSRNIAQVPGFNWARSNLITKAGVLAKRANQRIHEIVSHSASVRGSSNAYQYLRTRLKDKVPWLTTVVRKNKKTGEMQTDIKFTTNFRDLSDKEIQYRIKKIEEFLSAKTSKIKGVQSRIEKQTKAFNENTGQDYSEEEFVDQVMTTDVKDLFKAFDPSDIQALFSENREFALNANEILQAIVDEKKHALATLEWQDIEDGFREHITEVLEKKEMQKNNENSFVTDFEELMTT